MEGEAPGEEGGTGRRADLVSVEAVDLEAGFGEAVDGRSGDLGVVVADAVPAETAQASARRGVMAGAQLERGRQRGAGGRQHSWSVSAAGSYRRAGVVGGSTAGAGHAAGRCGAGQGGVVETAGSLGAGAGGALIHQHEDQVGLRSAPPLAVSGGGTRQRQRHPGATPHYGFFLTLSAVSIKYNKADVRRDPI